MPKNLILIVVLIVLLVVASAVALVMLFIKYVKLKGRPGPGAPVLGGAAGTSSKVATCARCGEQRIIVKPEDSLCAQCYSALRTKKD